MTKQHGTGRHAKENHVEAFDEWTEGGFRGGEIFLTTWYGEVCD